MLLVAQRDSPQDTQTAFSQDAMLSTSCFRVRGLAPQGRPSVGGVWGAETPAPGKCDPSFLRPQMHLRCHSAPSPSGGGCLPPREVHPKAALCLLAGRFPTLQTPQHGGSPSVSLAERTVSEFCQVQEVGWRGALCSSIGPDQVCEATLTRNAVSSPAHKDRKCAAASSC